LEPKVKLGLAASLLHLEALDVAFVLQYGGDCHLQLRRRHHDGFLLNALGVADPREHVRDGIAHAHVLWPPTTSSPSLGRGSARASRPRAAAGASGWGWAAASGAPGEPGSALPRTWTGRR